MWQPAHTTCRGSRCSRPARVAPIGGLLVGSGRLHAIVGEAGVDVDAPGCRRALPCPSSRGPRTS
eukprot:13263906-Alexandrium_andersonii.AAC.1